MELFQRASRVIPGGIFGHTAPAMLVPKAFPYYAVSGEGCRYRDPDGNEFLDFLCGYGPNILGYRHPEVDEAVQKAEAAGRCFNHPTPVMVDLADYLVDMVDFAEWVVFGKNGSDMTTWAISVAREKTGRKKVLRARESYHGVDPWCTPGQGGIIAEDRAHIHTFNWNDLESLEKLFKEFPNEVATVILTPVHQPLFKEAQMPDPGFFVSVRNLCDRYGALLILDDIRAGFRLHEDGSHAYLGVSPDMICFCKALANGYSISATLGTGELRRSSERVFLTGSYWNNPGPMAAALACLQIIHRDGVTDHIQKLGDYLAEGLKNKAADFGYTFYCTGPTSMPYFVFAGDPDQYLNQRFCSGLVQKGIFLHPHHNGFISGAHTMKDMEDMIQSSGEVWAEMREEGVTPIASETTQN